VTTWLSTCLLPGYGQLHWREHQNAHLFKTLFLLYQLGKGRGLQGCGAVLQTALQPYTPLAPLQLAPKPLHRSCVMFKTSANLREAASRPSSVGGSGGSASRRRRRSVVNPAAAAAAAAAARGACLAGQYAASLAGLQISAQLPISSMLQLLLWCSAWSNLKAHAHQVRLCPTPQPPPPATPAAPACCRVPGSCRCCCLCCPACCCGLRFHGP